MDPCLNQFPWPVAFPSSRVWTKICCLVRVPLGDMRLKSDLLTRPGFGVFLVALSSRLGVIGPLSCSPAIPLVILENTKYKTYLNSFTKVF